MRGLLAATGLAALVLGSSASVRPVESVDLKRYAGMWYEIARLPNAFQQDCAANVTATYTLRQDGRIDVVNRCRTADGAEKEARGIARRAGDGASNARLQVRFAPAILSLLPMVWGDYWIIGLAPDYHWAVVGEPSRQHLWILARTPKLPGSTFEQAVEIAKANGYDVAPLAVTPQGVSGPRRPPDS
jgi:apolipoprotein D and lipocalin family protein